MIDFKDLYDRTDATRWAHPELEEAYATQNAGAESGPLSVAFDFNRPFEERAAVIEEARKGLMDAVMAFPAGENPAIDRREQYFVPGCPEEPETQAEVIVYRPSKPIKKKLDVLLCAAGSGQCIVAIEFDIFCQLADRYGCLVVAPRYRTAMQGHRYPAAINDLHAAYEWVVANAEELGANPDKVVLFGVSTGSNLALSLAHRLKRYGHRPRGCVVACSFADNRPIFKTSTIRESWSRMQWLSSIEYLGVENLDACDDPEMFPNYATAEQCVGLCPTFMHPDSEEGNAASCRAYQDTLSQAGVYNELHSWGGSCHGVLHNMMFSEESAYAQRYAAVVDGNIRDCWKYDLRRSWIEEE